MEINKYIDLTLLKADATSADIIKLCVVAKARAVKSVCINPVYVPLVKKELAESNVLICSVIGFPLGANTINIKVAEALEAVNNGADEIDVVANIGKIKEGDIDYLKKELMALREVPATLKLIIETCYLSSNEIVMMTKLCDQIKIDYIKTSTGFGTAGATVTNIELMHQNITGDLKIKASGGIKTNKQALAIIKAGASRIGASSTGIMDE